MAKSKSTKPKSKSAPVQAPSPIAEIEQGPSKFEQFLDRNQRWLILGGSVVVVAVLGYVAWSTIRKEQRHSAGAALVAADDLTSLLDVVKNHAGTPAAESARLLSADALWKDGRQDKAIETLRKFLAESPNHAAAPTARASLGSRLMAQGKLDEAKNELQPLIDDSKARFLAPFALICLGDIARTNDDLDQAEQYFTRARDEYPENLFSSEATRHLLLLRAKLPTEVDPPPPPVVPGDAEAAPTPSPLPDSSKLLRPKIPATPAPAAPATPGTGKPAPAPPAAPATPAPAAPAAPDATPAPAEPDSSTNSPSTDTPAPPATESAPKKSDAKPPATEPPLPTKSENPTE